MKTRTDSYIFTADVISANDMISIETIRKTVSVSNKLARRNAKWSGKTPTLYRVCLKGRLGKNNPDAIIYRIKRDYQTIKLKHARYIDVYVQKR